MKTITKEYNVYKFEELNKEAQKEALDYFREESDLFYDDFIIDDWKEKLNDLGFEDAKIYYSGFYCQGDGASFDATINLEKLVSNIPELREHKYHWVLKYLETEYNPIKITTITSRYYHEKTKEIEIDRYYRDRLDARIDELESIIEDYRLDLCHQIYDSLQLEYEATYSDEGLKDFIECSEYEFLESGDIFK